MLKDRKELETYLVNKITEQIKNKNQLRDWTNEMEEMYNVPLDVATSLFSLRQNLGVFSNTILFYALNVINKDRVKYFFTENEIKAYASSKYTKEKVKFPISLSMMKVTDNQWIGTISVRELMKLKDAQLIYYNENTQRPLKRIVKGGRVDYWKISINNKAVDAILDSYESGTYIPNTITLCLPETSDYYYNEENHKLVIKSMKAFDIIDGYHRYVAMSRLALKNPDFDYPMELRVVLFDEERSKQFIWQEDQKTKMSKLDSNSYNIYDAGNQLTNYLNSQSLFAGNIHSNGIIYAPIFTEMFNVLLFGRESKQRKTQILIENRKRICESLNSLAEEHPELIMSAWDKKFVIAVAFCICKFDTNIYEKAIELSEKIKPGTISKHYTNRLEKMI